MRARSLTTLLLTLSLILILLSSCMTVREGIIIDKREKPAEQIFLYGGMTKAKHFFWLEGENSQGKKDISRIKVPKSDYENHEIGEYYSKKK